MYTINLGGIDNNTYRTLPGRKILLLCVTTHIVREYTIKMYRLRFLGSLGLFGPVWALLAFWCLKNNVNG